MDSAEGLHDVARRARECAVMGDAVTLARWIGSGRYPVTAGGVLRKADVPAAGAALGVEVPPRLRTMADIRALHRPWCAAVATGLLEVGGGSVTAGPALEDWPGDDADLLAGWLTGLRTVCAAESYPQDEDSVRLLALAVLTVLGAEGASRAGGLWQPVFEALQVLGDRYTKRFWEPVEAAGRDGDLETGGSLAGPADPRLPAGEMVAEAARFGDEEQQDQVARDWLVEREPVQAAREVLACAEGMSPLRRGVAVRLADTLGDDALPAWREFVAARCVGPYARAALAGWDRDPEPGDPDWEWLGTEAAASGGPRSIDQVTRLKVSLARFRPPRPEALR